MRGEDRRDLKGQEDAGMLEQLEAKCTWEDGAMEYREFKGEDRVEEEVWVKRGALRGCRECFWCGNVDRLCSFPVLIFNLSIAGTHTPCSVPDLNHTLTHTRKYIASWVWWGQIRCSSQKYTAQWRPKFEFAAKICFVFYHFFHSLKLNWWLRAHLLQDTNFGFWRYLTFCNTEILIQILLFYFSA